MKFEIVLSKAPEDISAVHDALYEYNLSQTGHQRVAVTAKLLETTEAFIVRGDDGNTYGGVVWHQLPDKENEIFVDYLFLSDVLRGSGKGRELIEAMEKYVKSCGIKTVKVTTNSFQAPKFYPAVGYKEIGSVAAPCPLVPDNLHFTYCKEL